MLNRLPTTSRSQQRAAHPIRCQTSENWCTERAMAENLRVVAAVSRASAEAPSHIVTSGCLIQDFCRLSLGQPRILCAQWRPLPRMSATKRNTEFSWCSIPSSDRSNEHWTMVRLRMSVVLDQRATLSDFSSSSTVRLSSIFFTSLFFAHLRAA